MQNSISINAFDYSNCATYIFYMSHLYRGNVVKESAYSRAAEDNINKYLWKKIVILRSSSCDPFLVR